MSVGIFKDFVNSATDVWYRESFQKKVREAGSEHHVEKELINRYHQEVNFDELISISIQIVKIDMYRPRSTRRAAKNKIRRFLS